MHTSPISSTPCFISSTSYNGHILPHYCTGYEYSVNSSNSKHTPKTRIRVTAKYSVLHWYHPIIEVPLLFMTPPFCRQKCSKIYLGEYQLKNATTIGSTNCSVSHIAAASVSCFKWGWTTRTWGLLAPVLLGILTISLQLLQFQALCIVFLWKNTHV